jgi:glyoxylase-like metal-dependent hydrolase (beta-lactamase superfamily II)
VVDPVLDRLGEVLRVLSEEQATLRHVVETHSHADHVSGAAALRERTGAEVVMHPEAPSEVATRRAADGEELPLGESWIRVRHAPGNTQDSLVLEVPGAVFTGDTLLIGTVGLRDVPGADPEAWFASLHRILDPLPDATVVHPGHDDMGRTQSTVGLQRGSNGWLRAEDRDTFLVRYAAGERPVCADATEILEANRVGARRVPREITAAGGLLDPAHTTEAALRGASPYQAGSAGPPPPSARGPLHGILLVGGAAALLGAVLGWGIHPALHGLSALAGLALVLLALRSEGGRRRRRSEPGLYYQGPVRRSIGG